MKWIGQHIFDLKSRFRNDVTIDGDLTVSGTYTQIDTDVTTTEQWLVTNDGTGPAAIINQKGSQDIFDVQDDGTSVFYIEDGGNVGIGTTSPAGILDVSGADNDVFFRRNAGQYFKFTTDAHSNRIESAGKTVFIGTTDAQTLYLKTNDSSRLTITSAGNVGIGTTSPQRLLDISAVTGATLRLTSTGDGLGSDASIGAIEFFGNDASAPGAGVKASITAQTGVALGDDADLIFKTSTGAANNVEVMRIDGSTSNVGIGTTSPGSKLDVNGTVKIVGDSSYLLFNRDDDLTQIGKIYDDSGFVIEGKSNSDLILRTKANGVGEGIRFQDTSSNNLMFIEGTNGNVGIGTTSPSEALEVSGKAIIRKSGSATAHGDTDLLVTDATATSSTAAIQILGGNAGFSNLQFSDTDSYSQGAVIYGHTDNYMAFKANAAEKMRITSAGNLGIGTTSPAYKLDVDGEILSDGLRLNLSATTQRAITSTGTDSIQIGDSGVNDIRFKNATGSVARFLANGNVGIGTTSPASLLHVAGTVQVGVDDTGHDVKFFGATSGRYMLWDESGDSLNLTDNTQLKIGAAADLRLYHDGSDSYVRGYNYDLIIMQDTADKDIKFKADDGSGGTATYLTLDGGLGFTTIQKHVRWEDGIIARFGNSDDGSLYHSGGHFYMGNNTGNIIIDNAADDADIIFKGTDGGADITALTLDMSDAGQANFNKSVKLPDLGVLKLGNSSDLQLWHEGGNSFIKNETGSLYIRNYADDEDIIFQSDDGSGGVETYFFLDGSASSGNPITIFPDLSALYFGTGTDLMIRHDGTDSTIANNGGDLYITQNTNDKDIIFQSDDGSGGVAEYFRLDGGLSATYIGRRFVFSDSTHLQFGNQSDTQIYNDGSNFYIDNITGDQDIIFKGTDDSSDITALTLDMSAAGKAIFNSSISIPDAGLAFFGTGGDLQINHDGSNSYVNHVGTGNMIIQNTTDDKDIIFKCDDGSGGVAEYFRLDGGLASPYTVFPDDSRLAIGGGLDLRFHHDGGSSYIGNYTGNLLIRNFQDDGDIVFQSDDGSGGVETYFFLDGSSGHTTFPDSKILSFGDSQDLRINHDGSTASIFNTTGNLQIINYADDSDVKLMSDDGSGGVTAYLTLDGSSGYTKAHKHILYEDDAKAMFGTGGDMQILHDGSNSYISQNVTGNLYIENNATDGDVILRSDDGSGGTTTYLTVDGSSTNMKAHKNFYVVDNILLGIGSGFDMRMYHDGSNSFIRNDTGNLTIFNNTNDGDIIFQSDDGSGGVETYMALDGGLSRIQVYKRLQLQDSIGIYLGTNTGDLMYHNGSNTFWTHQTGDLTIESNQDDGDIIFKSDDGSGGTTAYLTLDGGLGYTTAQKNIQFIDNAQAYFGTGVDLRIYHDGSNSYIKQAGTGDLYIHQTVDDRGIILTSDDGSGGTTAYLTIDGSATRIYVEQNMQLSDNTKLILGSGADLEIYHDGSNSYIKDVGTGSLNLDSNGTQINLGGGGENFAIFRKDAEVELYFNGVEKLATKTDGVNVVGELEADSLDIDGVADISGTVTLGTPLATDQQKHLAWFEIAGFGTGDGVNYEISVNLDNDTAPFSHNVSIGEDGTTAITVQNIMRSGGTVMPRAGTIKRWKGWATTAGSSTANVALFKITPARNDNSDVSPVLIDNASYTAFGNAKMENFEETSFTDASVAAGDIVVTGIKCENNKTTYFSSTLEIEF